MSNQHANTSRPRFLDLRKHEGNAFVMGLQNSKPNCLSHRRLKRKIPDCFFASELLTFLYWFDRWEEWSEAAELQRRGDAFDEKSRIPDSSLLSISIYSESFERLCKGLLDGIWTSQNTMSKEIEMESFMLKWYNPTWNAAAHLVAVTSLICSPMTKAWGLTIRKSRP
ncbi:hypothetical protein V6N13_055564 [Hibiscus sabdariffa]|uniref:Uncharacterized protein n=2 Tax=Hibiscus sabdariffa TaxID=183260 RepID=A0ABR2BLT0_9ROSI